MAAILALAATILAAVAAAVAVAGAAACQLWSVFVGEYKEIGSKDKEPV